MTVLSDRQAPRPMRTALFATLLLLAGCAAPDPTPHPTAPPERPNVILVFADDLGYGDIGAFGSWIHRTPHLDRLAAEGLRLTSFYSTSGVCTPSRASLMTGSYPRRVSLDVNARPYGETGRQVLFPVA
ncbi:MAG: sulfatase-like hydrolase/transferase, partial [Phycisphaerae bacterium]